MANHKGNGKSLEPWIWDADSRGSGNASTNKEKTFRQWFVDEGEYGEDISFQRNRDNCRRWKATN